MHMGVYSLYVYFFVSRMLMVDHVTNNDKISSDFFQKDLEKIYIGYSLYKICRSYNGYNK